MAKVLHLSKLSRGHVELSESGSRLEIFADKTERPLARTSRHNLPKTYSTKRGPLILFAETGLIKNSQSKIHRDKKIANPTSLISPPPLKFGELKRSILAYGGTPENQFSNGIVDEDGTFIHMKIPSKKRQHPSKYAGINPNILLKRRYILASTEDKRRDLDSILDSDYSSSRNQHYSIMKTHVLSDEISLIPPIYRNPDINQHTTPFLSNTYRFFKIENSILLNDNENTERLSSQPQDTLQIIDSKGSRLSYETLEQSEKEKILADLLIQTALQNIFDQQNIEVFEDALNRVRDSDINNNCSLIDLPIVVKESSIPLVSSDTISDHNQIVTSYQTSSESSSQQRYMFGKMPGSKWARNRPLNSNTLPIKSKHRTNEIEQQSEEYSSEYSQTTSQCIPSKLFRVSRLLAPITTSSSNQDSSSIRNQQHYSTKLPIKLRKHHDIDFNQHKITRKNDDYMYSQHVSSRNDTPQDKSTNEKEISSINLFSRQRSSKSSKQNRSRQATGKTLTTNRCVSSPLSVDQEAERLLAIDSFNEDYVDDNNSTRTTIIDDALVRNATNSAKTKTDDENDEHLHPSEMNVLEDSVVSPPKTKMRRSAYTNRSHVTTKSMVPPGALLIAPDGEILSVGGPTGHSDADYEEYLTTHNSFAHQPSTESAIFENNDDKSAIIAPCVPVVLGTKRERLPGETIVRRTLNLTGGDFNSQIDLQSWSYDVPMEKRHIPPQTSTLTRPPPPLGLSAFTGQKYHHHQKRVAQEVRDHAMLPSTSFMHSEAAQQQQQRIVSHSTSKNRSNVESQTPVLAFTSWTYRRPQSPAMTKQPYLFRPDYRPTGAYGHKHQLGDRETLIRRTINVHAGDIDASLSFTIWVYDLWINDLVKNGANPNYIKQVRSLFDLFKQRKLRKVDLQDKEFLTTLANHAQALARIILKRSDSGYHLAEDAQLAIIENIRNLKYLLDQRLESVSDDVYRDILRDTLQHVLRKGNLEHLQITDEILMALMDYPIEAFEIYLDSETNEEYIRIKSAYRVRKTKIKAKKTQKKTKTVIISEEIFVDDFEKIIDENIDEYVYRFKKNIAERKGFIDLMEINFDIKKYKNTGKNFVEIKTIPNNFDFKVEIFNDPDTGKQMLIWRKEILKTPPTIQSDISIEDFELVTDEKTGETVFRLKVDVAIRKGLTNLSQTNFEVFNDSITGETVMRIKDNELNQMNNNRVEIITDIITGKQTIRTIVDDNESNEPLVTIIENDIDINDLERIIDPLTGREILRIKADILKTKGLDELANEEFEIIIDDITGQSRIVLKTSSLEFDEEINTNFEITIDIKTGKQKIIKKILTEKEDDHVDIIESQLNIDDFQRIIDRNTGLEVLQLKKGAATRKGLSDLLNVQFEIMTDADGKQTIVVKGGGNQGNTDDAKFELITDASGRTTIKIKKERPPTPELEVTEKSIDINDFEEIIDPKTGFKVLKLKSDVAKRAGMMELLDAQFETYIDTETGKQAIRIKQNGDNVSNDIKFEIVTDASGKQILKMIQEIPKTVEVTNSDINTNDFEEIIDEKTGEKILRMKKEVAERKGFIDMDNVDFELIIDDKTGQEIVQIKNNIEKLTKGNVSFAMIIDPTTGQQTLRMKQEVEVKFEKIENDLIIDDFEEVIDKITGERILKLTAEVAAKKGLNDLCDIAFEVYLDPISGKEQIRMKGGNQTGKLDDDQKFEIYVDQKTGQQKIVVNRPKERTPPPVEKSIDVNDFEKIIDPNTGKESYRLIDEAIRRKGLTNVKHVEFDLEIDSTTGKRIMKPKVNTNNGQKVEVISDKTTGEQMIRIVQEKPLEKLATTTIIDLDKNAFSIQIDPKTGKQIINLSKNIIENYGLENIEFEQIIDQKTGETIYQMKPLIGKDGKIYELITDLITGKQSLQVKETFTQKQLTNLIENREAKGLRIPIIPGQTSKEQDIFPIEISTSSKKKDTTLSPDGNLTPSPVDKSNRRKSQVSFKSQSIRIKSSSGSEYEIEWTTDDEKEINNLNISDQRKRKEQMLAEKKRKVAEMKRQETLAIQHRLKKQRESLVSILEQSNDLFNKEEQEHVVQWERDLRKLDTDREGLTEEEYQLHRKKLFAERTHVLKGAYDRQMDRLKGQTDAVDSNPIDDDEAAQLDAQVQAEEELLLSMMNPEERDDYIRARNEERARQLLLSEREHVKREEELQAALAETKRMATERTAEIMAKELQKRSTNSMYAELKDLVTEQKVSRAFTYSYFSLLQFLSPNSSNPVD